MPLIWGSQCLDQCRECVVGQGVCNEGVDGDGRCDCVTG